MDSDQSDEEIQDVKDFAKCYVETGRVINRARDLYEKLYPNRRVPYVNKEIMSLLEANTPTTKIQVKVEEEDPVVAEDTPVASPDWMLEQIPIVYTKKLDDMRVFKKNTDYLSFNDLLNSINNESKPKLKNIVKHELCTDLVSFYTMSQKLNAMKRKLIDENICHSEAQERNEEASSKTKQSKTETASILIEDDKLPVKNKETSDNVQAIVVDSDSEDDCLPLAKISKTNVGRINALQSTRKQNNPGAMKRPGQEADTDSLKLYRRVFLSFICSYSNTIDLYYIETDGSVTEYYNIIADNMTKKLADLAKYVGYVKTVLFKCCCWFKRNEFTSLLRSIPERSVVFMSQPHNCSHSSCNCCCRPKTATKNPTKEPAVSWVMKDATSSIGVINMKEDEEIMLLEQEIANSLLKLTEKRNANKTKPVTGKNKWLHKLQETATQETLVNKALLTSVDQTPNKTNGVRLIPKQLHDIWTKGHIVMHVTTRKKNLEEIYEFLEGKLISSSSILKVAKSSNRWGFFANKLFNSYSHFDENLNVIRSIQVPCCWFLRDTLVRHESHHDALNYIRSPHDCPINDCKCCCKSFSELKILNKAVKHKLINDSNGQPLFFRNPSTVYMIPSPTSVSEDLQQEAVLKAKGTEITINNNILPATYTNKARNKKATTSAEKLQANAAEKDQRSENVNKLKNEIIQAPAQNENILRNALLKKTTSGNRMLEVGISLETKKLSAKIVHESSVLQPSRSLYSANTVDDEVTDLTTPPVSPSPPLVGSPIDAETPLSAVDDPTPSSTVTLVSSDMACTITTYSVTEHEASSALASATDPLGFDSMEADTKKYEDDPLDFDITSENITETMDDDSDPLSFSHTIKLEDTPTEAIDENADPLSLESTNENKSKGLRPDNPKNYLEPRNINVDMLISTILERFRDVRLFINDKGNVTADLNAPLGSLSTAELKVLANILAHAQEQVKSLGLRPGTVLNGQFKMAGKVKAISGISKASVNSRNTASSTFVPQNTGGKLPSSFATPASQKLPPQPKINNVYSLHTNAPGSFSSHPEPPQKNQIRVIPPDKLSATESRPLLTVNNMNISTPNMLFPPVPMSKVPVFVPLESSGTISSMLGFLPQAIPDIIDNMTGNEPSDTEFLLPVIVPSSVKSVYEDSSESNITVTKPSRHDKELEDTIGSFNNPVNIGKVKDLPSTSRQEWILPVYDMNSSNTATCDSILNDIIIEIDDDD